jgi:hypothetical protein
MKKKDLIYRIIQNTNEEQCLIIGDFTVKNIIRDFVNSNEAGIKKYMPGEYGHEMGITEAILLLFASIQAIESFLNILTKLKKKKVDNGTIDITITEILIEKKIPASLTDEIKREILNWLEDEMD